LRGIIMTICRRGRSIDSLRSAGIISFSAATSSASGRNLHFENGLGDRH
jgi:hypothetical protein